RVTSSSDVPGPPTGFHGVVHGGAALALDHVTSSVRFLDHEQPVVEGVDHVAGDGCEPDLTQSPAIAQKEAADQAKTAFVSLSRPRVQFREAAVAPVLTEDPVERAGDGAHSGADIAAAAPSIEGRQQRRLRPLHCCRIITAERLVVQRTTGGTRPG